MKKTISVILCAVIFITAALTLAGCKKSDAKKIIGKWAGSIDIAGFMNEEFEGMKEMGISLEEELKELPVAIEFEFNKDGTYKVKFDEKSFDEFFGKLKDSMKKVFESSFKEAAKEAGITLEQFMEFSGTSLDELVEQSFSDEVKKEMKDDGSSEGKYKLENGKLFMTDEKDGEFKEDEYVNYAFIGDDLLNLKEAVGGDKDDVNRFMFPVNLDKQK